MAKDQIAERMATSSKARSQDAGRSQTDRSLWLPSHDWPLGLSSGRRERPPTRSRLGAAGSAEALQTHWEQRS
jgi:hypothetical protein